MCFLCVYFHRDPVVTKKLFTLHRPTHVINLAAKVGGLFDNMKHNVDYMVIFIWWS